MIRYKEKAAMALGVVLVSASLLTACNTAEDTAMGVENTANGVGQTVNGAATGAEQDLQATEKAMSPAHQAAVRRQSEGDAYNEPAG